MTVHVSVRSISALLLLGLLPETTDCERTLISTGRCRFGRY